MTTRRLLAAVLSVPFVLPVAMSASADSVPLNDLQVIGRYETGIFDESAAEIVAYDAVTKRLFVVNAEVGVDILDITDPTAPTKISQILVPDGFDGINSVAVNGGRVAAAVQGDGAQTNGAVFFYDTSGMFQQQVTVGVLPDSLAFSPDGSKVVVANEAEPDVELDEDEENVVAFNGDALGTISVIDTATFAVTNLDFSSFSSPAQEAAFRAGGGLLSLKDATLPGGASVTLEQDLEPEFVAISPDGSKAFVTVQENNAIAVVNLETNTIENLIPLGLKDNNLPGNALDPSNRDDEINIRNGPTLSAYAPDAIDVFEKDGETYLIIANEGDARDFDIRRIKDLDIDPGFNPSPYASIEELQEDENFGRLEASLTQSDTDGDGDADRLVAFGARSFSILKVTPDGLEQVFDSGDALEQITAVAIPDFFNTTNDENAFEDRSDDAGPEPEAVTIAEIDGSIYAFVGLERIGGVVVYDITDPTAPEFLQYVNNRNFSQDVEVELAGILDEEGEPVTEFNPLVGDLGPEGLLFISAEDSPTGLALLVVSNEVSGSTTIYSVSPVPSPAAAGMGIVMLAGLASRRRRRS